VSGSKHIAFFDVDPGPRELRPGDSFTLTMPYEASADYEDAELDVAVYDARDPDLYYQATNRAYGRNLDLAAGRGTLVITLKNLQISGSIGRVVVALWAKNRREQLFWWRIPVEFSSMEASTGKNFLPLEFEVKK
jgi:hypothetical protein